MVKGIHISANAPRLHAWLSNSFGKSRWKNKLTDKAAPNTSVVLRLPNNRTPCPHTMPSGKPLKNKKSNYTEQGVIAKKTTQRRQCPSSLKSLLHAKRVLPAHHFYTNEFREHITQHLGDYHPHFKNLCPAKVGPGMWPRQMCFAQCKMQGVQTKRWERVRIEQT